MRSTDLRRLSNEQREKFNSSDSTNPPLGKSSIDDSVEWTLPLKEGDDDRILELQSFIKILTKMNDNEAKDFIDPYELPQIKPYRIVIHQARHFLLQYFERDTTTSTATLFCARQYAIPVAKALLKIRLRINYYGSLPYVFCLRLIDTGEDAEKIAHAIEMVTEKNFDIISIFNYISLLLQLKNHGIELSQNICLFIARVNVDNRPGAVESLISLYTANFLIEPLCLNVAWQNQYNKLKPIAGLLLFLKDKIILSEAAIEYIIVNNAYATRLQEKITLLTNPTQEGIMKIFKDKFQPRRDAPKICDSKLILKLTAEGRMTEEFANHIFLVMHLYNKYQYKEKIVGFLCILQEQDTPITTELISIVLYDVETLDDRIEEINDLIINGIQPSQEIVKLLQTAPLLQRSCIILNIKKLKNNINLPTTFLIDPPKNTFFSITEKAVIQCVLYKNMGIFCKILSEQNRRAQLEELNDLILMCILSRNTVDIPDLLDFYQNLYDEGIALDHNEEIAFAILTRNEKVVGEKLLTAHRHHNTAMLEHLKTNKILKNYLPNPLITCIISFFGPKSNCRIEVVEDDSSLSKQADPLSPKIKM